MVDRSIACLILAGALLCLPQTARAAAESTVGPQVESILSYSPQTETAQAAKEAPDQRESSKATEDCRGCHEDNLTLYNRTYHAAQEESCFSCHKGAAAEEHLKGQQEGNDVPGPSIEALDSGEANAICLSCHESSHHPTWEGGMHDRRDVKCIDCHAVHSFQSERSQLKQASASEVCSACHPAIRAMSLRTSHHPVREGLMGCESCHNPHDGSRPKMIKADWANELCLQCHTEKRGPFLWEHAPVRESCLNCHNPHGSNHDKLLVAKPPYLCQRCHLNTRHPGTLYDGVNAGGTLAAASNRAVEHACKNCHQNIHGGNAPSGPYLGR
jgi:DmsE family decaheme c-type cytochrome